MKIGVTIISVVIFQISCYQVRKVNETKTVKFSTEQKNLRGLPFQGIKNAIFENIESKPVDTVGLNLIVDTFVIKKFDFNFEQEVYDRFCTQKMSSEELEHNILLYNIDTSKLSRNEGTTSVKIYIGVIYEKGFWISCDINNNNSFADENKYFVADSESQKIDLLPLFIKKDMVYFFNQIEQKVDYYFKIMPVVRSELNQAQNERQIKEIFCYLISNNVKVGNFKVGLRKYKFYALQMNSKIIYDTKSTVFGFLKRHTPVYDYRYKPISYLSPFKLNNRNFIIDSLSPTGDFASITYLGKHKEKGVKSLIDSPMIYSLVRDKKMSLRNYFASKKYLIINFWGTWCKPCIEEFPELKKIVSNIDSSQYSVLSIAYDKLEMLSKVKELIELHGLSWNQGIIDRADEKSLVDLFGIYSFPTFLIVDDASNIILREVGSDGLRKIKLFLFK
jgi:thiol-disulfide isomerase/thioredoxin